MSNFIPSTISQKYNSKIGYILLFLLLFVGPPFVIEHFPGFPGWKVLYLLIYPLLFIYACKHRIKLFSNRFKRIIISWVLGWGMFAILHQDSIYISRCLIAIIVFTIVSFIYSIGTFRYVKYFIYLMLIFSIFGAISFFLYYFVGIHPLFEYENVDGRTGYCFGLTCSNVFSSIFFRYSGYFDEPGAMGLWGLLAILLNKLTLNNRKIEITLIVCLLFTFSVGYFISVVAYILLIVIDFKNLKTIFLFGLLMSLCLVFISKDEQLSSKLFGRLQYDESTGTLTGNTRSDEQDQAKIIFLTNPLIGVGASEAEKMGQQGYSINSNVLSPLAKDGIIGVMILYFPFLLSLWRNRKNKVAFRCLLVYSLSFFHRPIIVGVFDLTMYLIFLEVIKYNTQNINLRLLSSHYICKDK